ncbi:hypothetical protein W02_24750 [Nitrospira sp. KM1]|nr:hypothetical protein W02_24750 [Nitrospira sp. KM1]
MLHELAHAIFDACTEGASIDFLEAKDLIPSLSEERAEAFAKECLVPREVLIHMTSKLGINWHALSSKKLAELVGMTHCEQRTVLSAAVDNELISEDERNNYINLEISEDLLKVSERALSAGQFIRKKGIKPEWQNKRNTTIPTRTLRLPSSYILRVLDALRIGNVSTSKAAELLMIDEGTFYSRFNDKVPAYSE